MHPINFILGKFNLWLSRISPRPFEEFGVKGEDLIGAEIGVYKGEHAESILKNLSIKKLYLIDPYKEYEEGNKHYGVEQDTLAYAELVSHDKVKSDKVIWIKKKSIEATKEVPNNLDFVYIDGAHDYNSVKEDIENYYPKIKEGGVLGGHDIFNGYTPEHDGVIQAVTEFAVNNNLKLKIQSPDWWVVKKCQTKQQ